MTRETPEPSRNRPFQIVLRIVRAVVIAVLTVLMSAVVIFAWLTRTA
jgi:hypothetical protein